MTAPLAILCTRTTVWARHGTAFAEFPAATEEPSEVSRAYREIVAQLQLPGVADEAVVVHPSHWGAPRCSDVAAATRELSRSVSTEPTALLAHAAVVQGRTRAERVVVLEVGTLATTATYLDQRAGRYEMVSCEIAPTGMADVRADPAGAEAVADVARAVIAERPFERFIITSDAPAEDVTVLVAALSARYPRIAPANVVTSHEVLAAAVPETVTPAAPPPVQPPARWLHDEPVPDDERSPVTKKMLIAAAALAVVVIVGLAAVALFARGGGGEEAAAQPAQTSSAGFVPPLDATSTGTPATPPSGASEAITLGKVRIVPPPGWQAQAQGEQRVNLTPPGGGKRIVVMQNTLSPGAGYDEVAAGLAARIAGSGHPDKFGPVQRDVTFGGRPGISYTETPDEKSQVKWHVMVEHDTQVSVGCQYLAGGWDGVSRECEQLVRTLVLAP